MLQLWLTRFYAWRLGLFLGQCAPVPIWWTKAQPKTKMEEIMWLIRQLWYTFRIFFVSDCSRCGDQPFCGRLQGPGFSNPGAKFVLSSVKLYIMQKKVRHKGWTKGQIWHVNIFTTETVNKKIVFFLLSVLRSSIWGPQMHTSHPWVLFCLKQVKMGIKSLESTKNLKRGGHCFALDHKESLKILLFYVHNENVTFFSDKMHTKQVN